MFWFQFFSSYNYESQHKRHVIPYFNYNSKGFHFSANFSKYAFLKLLYDTINMFRKQYNCSAEEVMSIFVFRLNTKYNTIKYEIFMCFQIVQNEHYTITSCIVINQQ